MKGDLEDGIHVNGGSIPDGGLEFPFGERFEGTLVEAVVEVLKQFDMIDVTVGADYGRQTNFAFYFLV